MSSARPAVTLDVGFGVGGIDEVLQYARNEQPIIVQRGATQASNTGFVADAGFVSCGLGNSDRRFDPLYLAGPYTSGGVSGVEAGISGTARANWNAVDYGLLDGQVDDWQQENPSPKDATVPFRLTDGVGAFSRAPIYAAYPAQWSGDRIQAIVDEIGWPGDVAISRGNCRVAPLTLGQTNAWTHMQSVAMAEWGDLYFDKDGTLVFRDRDLISSEARSITPQAVYSDLGTLGAFPYSQVGRTTLPIINDATLTFGTKGDQRNAQDAVSIALPRGLRTWQNSLPIHTPGQAQQYVNWLVGRYKDPVHTFDVITWTLPASFEDLGFDSSALFTELLTRELSDMVTIEHQPLGGGDPIIRNVWLRGIHFEFGQSNWLKAEMLVQDASWITGLAHFDVDNYDGPNVFSQ